MKDRKDNEYSNQFHVLITRNVISKRYRKFYYFSLLYGIGRKVLRVDENCGDY